MNWCAPPALLLLQPTAGAERWAGMADVWAQVPRRGLL